VVALVLLGVLTYVVAKWLYSIIEYFIGPKRGLAAALELLGVLLFWVALVFVINWAEANVPALRPITGFVKMALNKAADMLGVPHPF